MGKAENDNPEVHRGEEVLRRIGYGERIGAMIPLRRGGEVFIQDFLQIPECAEHVGPVVDVFMQLGEDHPLYERIADNLRAGVDYYASRQITDMPVQKNE